MNLRTRNETSLERLEINFQIAIGLVTSKYCPTSFLDILGETLLKCNKSLTRVTCISIYLCFDKLRELLQARMIDSGAFDASFSAVCKQKFVFTKVNVLSFWSSEIDNGDISL